ncbi:glycoside hydrolase family 57 [Maridesulfovibrio hydrothermalis]|uniref:Glycoside hydrolase family 57 n=1 Tax=Maridesulfovibrio hydrothermalis AM13 = DSM 14728 TaxID=1121451 RepID=L0RDG1_9BACT|nr:glycoside hydrolase family 57 [Maridesulfovibrio hydrothermalis]CCO23596.1 Glycoside hydrolase family 57 [Maridesulfovibrio hydrothermalis AM13 = DSM 14728]
MKLFAIFHLNMMFSSIPEEDRKQVIKSCYWPLLELIDKYGFPLGIEASGITLEIIQSLDPKWIDKFCQLLHAKRSEYIGSGYAQIVGPLVPASVNKANLRIGHKVSERILGLRSDIALVNEQAWSAGLVEHYLEAGYKGVFMDYDNSSRFAGWDESIQHYPQKALGLSGESIPILWNRSVVFQKLQRLAHAEIELSEYLNYLEVLETGDGWLPVYGNDAEIFDFRPGRYRSEVGVGSRSEWDFIKEALTALRDKHNFYLPSQVLNDLDHRLAGRKLKLCSAEQPVPVKKQQKYNLTRWAVSGKNDFRMNSLCRAIAAKLEKQDFLKATIEEKWRELCFCWASDFRTHITLNRFNKAERRLFRLAESVGAKINEPAFDTKGEIAELTSRLLSIKTDKVSVELNTAKGLAIHKCFFAEHEGLPAFGTLEHGYFIDIGLGADFFSGHIIIEGTGSPKETDLSRVLPRVSERDDFIQVSGKMEIHQGHIEKAVKVYKYKQQVDILYRFQLTAMPQGYLRLGHITLLTGHFNKDKLFYAVASGGNRERFSLKGKSFDHSNNVSFLVSSSHAAGMTDSSMIIGGEEAALVISPLIKEHAFIAMVTCRQAAPSPFVRVAFSMQEMDETSVHNVGGSEQFIFTTGFSIKPYPKGRQQ